MRSYGKLMEGVNTPVKKESGDLISRTKIRNYIKKQINPYGKPFEGSVYEFGLKLMEYIDNMFDAYNVDKVVAELEHSEDIAKCEYIGLEDESARGAMCAYASAIEIVRKGGVECSD